MEIACGSYASVGGAVASTETCRISLGFSEARVLDVYAAGVSTLRFYSVLFDSES
jgi:hypothetical protein